MRIPLLADITNAVGWISRAFTGDAPSQKQRDVPGWLARWLFRIGTVWAAMLLPITGFSCIFTTASLVDHLMSSRPWGSLDRTLFIIPYILAGYAVWVGWGWRSRQPRKVTLCILFWLASAGFNVVEPVHIWLDCESLADFLGLLWNPLLLWGIGATGVSLIALILEFFPTQSNGEAT